MKRSIRYLLIVVGVIVVAAGVTLAVLRWGARPLQTVTVSAAVDDQARAAIQQALADFDAQNKKLVAKLLPKDVQGGDLSLGPYQEGATVWRSVGWRLWAVQETLAKLESSLGRQLILPLRSGNVEAGDFEAMLEDLRRAGLSPIVMPASPPEYMKAIAQYAGRLGGQPDAWKQKKWLIPVPDLRAAVDALQGSKAVFLLGSDTMKESLGARSTSHPEGFPLPGSHGSWVLGRGEGFVVSPTSPHKAAALDVLSFLTSRGVARRFSQELTGDFYYWTKAPAAGRPPMVDGPTIFINPEG